MAAHISPRSLIRGDLPGLVLSVLAAQVLRHLDAMGVRVSIDDFGAGYTSLSYLKTLPVKALKIDRGLVTHLLDRVEDEAITQAVIGLGHRLGLDVLAEGVETAEVYRRLHDLHCDDVRGYLLTRPLFAAALEGWLASWDTQRDQHRVAAPADGDHADTEPLAGLASPEPGPGRTGSRRSGGSGEPVERDVGDRGGGVVGDEVRRVVHVGELDAIGVPLGIAADPVDPADRGRRRHRRPRARARTARSMAGRMSSSHQAQSAGQRFVTAVEGPRARRPTRPR